MGIYNVAKGVETEVLQLKLTSRLVKGACFMKRIRFIRGEDGSNQILIGAGGPRGPSILAIFTMDGTLVKEVQVDTKIMKYLSVDENFRHCAIGVVQDEGGGKSVWRLPDLSLVKRKKNVSAFPPEAVAFLGGGTVVSGAGDNSIHLLNPKGGGGAGGLIQFLFMTLIAAFIIFLFMRIGLKGAALNQGSGEL